MIPGSETSVGLRKTPELFVATLMQVGVVILQGAPKKLEVAHYIALGKVMQTQVIGALFQPKKSLRITRNPRLRPIARTLGKTLGKA